MFRTSKNPKGMPFWSSSKQKARYHLILKDLSKSGSYKVDSVYSYPLHADPELSKGIYYKPHNLPLAFHCILCNLVIMQKSDQTK